MPARPLKFTLRLFLTAILLALVPACSRQQTAVNTVAPKPRAEASVRPGMNKAFLDPELDPEQWVERFEGESREIFNSRHEIVEALALRQGHDVADIGAGTGFFTILFADTVGPDGWVHAVEIAPAFVERIGGLADQRGLTNITPLLGAEDNVRLAPGSVDIAFVCDTYHHFEYPKSTLASIRRALRPGGRLVIVDFEREPGVSRDWVLDHVRGGKALFRSEIEAAGFEFLREENVPGLEENYFIEFRRS